MALSHGQSCFARQMPHSLASIFAHFLGSVGVHGSYLLTSTGLGASLGFDSRAFNIALSRALLRTIFASRARLNRSASTVVVTRTLSRWPISVARRAVSRVSEFLLPHLRGLAVYVFPVRCFSLLCPHLTHQATICTLGVYKCMHTKCIRTL